MVINQAGAPITWTEWLELSDLLRRAMSLEAEEVIRARERARAEQERNYEKQISAEALKVKFPSEVRSATNHLFK